MCTVCGCQSEHAQHLGHSEHGQEHAHNHQHDSDGALNFATGAAGTSAPGQSQSRLVRVEQDILARNNALAAENRARFSAADVLTLNLVSSPGAGKTSLLVATLERLGSSLPLAVIEGDQETSADAERIRATGVPAVQVNTGKGCHLDARMVASAIDHIGLPEQGMLFIENVGNLVCPAGFDLGEAHKVVMCSVTEGEDKPLKYPGLFAIADVLLITKIDLLPHLDFDVDTLINNARRVNPRIGVLQVSARSGSGIDAWLEWLHAAAALRRIAGS